MKWDAKQWRKIGIGLLVVALAMIGAACGKKEPAPQEQTQAAGQEAMRVQDKWMTQGDYAPCTEAVRQQLIQAVDAVEVQPSYQIGLYSDDHANLAMFDGEICGQDAHFSFRRNNEENAWEFFVIGDRFYPQNGDGVIDNGPDSRAEGEKLYKPLFSDIRVSLKQALNGEMKDLGAADFNGTPVHKYDFRAVVPDQDAGVLTATLEIHEAKGVLVHAVIGQGIGSDASPRRFAKLYREIAVDKIGAVKPVKLPEGVTITPREPEDIEMTKPELR